MFRSVNATSENSPSERRKHTHIHADRQSRHRHGQTVEMSTLCQISCILCNFYDVSVRYICQSDADGSRFDVEKMLFLYHIKLTLGTEKEND